MDPKAAPVKRTALGRMAHEGATVTLARDGRVVVYMGDDDFRSKFEHIYKFVSRRPYVPGSGAAANRDLLDDGTLYVARFDAGGAGDWLPLRAGEGVLDAAHGFPSQAEVVIDARTAADLVGGTYMDRPEWIAVHPQSKEVYCTLTNNSLRGKGKPPGGDAPLGADAANPRAPNAMGHIIRWREQDGDAAATQFSWDIFLLAGDPASPDPQKRGNVAGGVAFAQPDGIVFDERGVLWIQTDASAQNMAGADWDRIGNNQMLAADTRTGEVRRFLTGPVGCEITGVTFAPGMRALFVNIQHPGESSAVPVRPQRPEPTQRRTAPGPTATPAPARAPPPSSSPATTAASSVARDSAHCARSVRLGGGGGRSRSRCTSAPLRGEIRFVGTSSGSGAPWGRRAGAKRCSEAGGRGGCPVGRS